MSPGNFTDSPERIPALADEHVHEFEQWATFHRAPTGPYPGHTEFVILKCECGAMEAFPKENYELCTPAFKEQLQRTVWAG